MTYLNLLALAFKRVPSLPQSYFFVFRPDHDGSLRTFDREQDVVKRVRRNDPSTVRPVGLASYSNLLQSQNQRADTSQTIQLNIKRLVNGF